jgi:hypothetical protein
MAKSSIYSTARPEGTKHILLTDLSDYNPDVKVTDAIYRVTLPNFNKYVDVPYVPNTALALNSNVLGLTSASDHSGLCDLPAGLYKIRQSICPNDKLFYEYCYFHVEGDLQAVAEKICAAWPDKNAVAELYALKRDFEIAKMLGEDCCNAKEAIALYNLTKAKSEINC